MKTKNNSRNNPAEWSLSPSRPRYFARQLITPDEMTLEAQYFRNKLRMHNRMLHGWGVVCGASVRAVPKSDDQMSFEPWQVLVEPGYILGPCGDEIIIGCNRVLDVRTGTVVGSNGTPCAELEDPWCSNPTTEPSERTLYVAIKYQEIMTRPVRVQPVGCGCDDAACEYSRWCDGYEIQILDHCPHEEQPTPDKTTDMTALLGEGIIPDCPECPTEPWVGLAAFKVDGDGIVSDINNCSCRRLVVSLASLWWQCQDEAAKSVGKRARQTVTKSAISRKFVSQKYAKSHPKTTFQERVVPEKKEGE